MRASRDEHAAVTAGGSAEKGPRARPRRALGDARGVAPRAVRRLPRALAPASAADVGTQTHAQGLTPLIIIDEFKHLRGVSRM